MGVALKGGNNAEHHNHNDVGTFVVVVDRTTLLVDPGAEVYTARTFGPKRYDSKVLNSYGHPVPVVAGALQSEGEDARAEVLRTEFTEDSDTLALDMKAAYAAEELKQLTRTFVYSRSGRGALTVTDEVEFSRPGEFGSALITLSEWERQETGTIRVSDGDAAVRVAITVEGADFDVRAATIEEDVRTKKRPTRIGIALKAPVVKAKVVFEISTDRSA
jgi:hypothetical protein